MSVNIFFKCSCTLGTQKLCSPLEERIDRESEEQGALLGRSIYLQIKLYFFAI
jgi:hypothetical protein